MITSIEGDEATGKTTLAYTGPLPIVGFQFDMGAERAIYGGRFVQHFEGLDIHQEPYNPGLKADTLTWPHDITVFELPQPIQLSGTRIVGCKELWEYFIVLVAKAMSDPKVRTIVIDTMTVARRVKAEAHLQDLQEHPKPGAEPRIRLQQVEWGPPNDAVRNLFTMASGLKKNLVAIHHLTDERGTTFDKDGVAQSVLTGNRMLEGLNHTYRFVDIALRMTKVRGKGTVVVAEMLKCGYNLALEGITKENPCYDDIIDWVNMGGRLNLDRRQASEGL